MEQIIKKDFFIRLKEATRPTLSFVYKYRYRFALLLGVIIVFFPSLMVLFYSVFSLKQ